MAVILAALMPGMRPALDGYLRHAIPFFASVLLVHVAANNIVRLKPNQPEFDLRGDLLVLCSWPVYTLALVATVLRAHVAGRAVIGHGPRRCCLQPPGENGPRP